MIPAMHLFPEPLWKQGFIQYMQIFCTLSHCNGSLVCLCLHIETQGPSHAPQTRLKNGEKIHGAHLQAVEVTY